MGQLHSDKQFGCCNAEFIQLVYSEANTVSEGEKKSTINPEHIVCALESLGFTSLLDEVNAFLKQVKDTDQKRSEPSRPVPACSAAKLGAKRRVLRCCPCRSQTTRQQSSGA